MTRDVIKDKVYFDNFIKLENEDIADYKTSIETHEVAAGQEESVYDAIFNAEMEIWIACYSRGDDLDALVKPYIELVKSAVVRWTADDYEKMMWLMSIGIMLEVDKEIFDMLIRLVKRHDVKDYLLQSFINYYEGQQGDSIIYPIKFERRLVKNILLSDKETATKNLAKHIKNWYAMNHTAYWYNLHNSEEQIYFGYWSFECGAVVKIRGLDDSALKDTQYYPYDLVHFSDKKSQE